MGRTDEDQRPLKRLKKSSVPLKSAMKKPTVSSSIPFDKTSLSKTSTQNSSKPLPRSRGIDKGPVKKPKPAHHAPTPPPKPKGTKIEKKMKLEKGKAKATPKPTAKIYPSTFKIVVGTYEKLLYGLEGSYVGEGGSTLESPTLKPIFIIPAHVSCVKAVAASPEGGKWLATGSTDEIIKIWDLRRRKEVGDLVQHEGSITYLDFPTRSHLVSASEDGTICIFRVRDWILLRSMKGHKGRVNSVAVHPSGKVGLSVGKDRTLRMWDLIRGKGSASTKLGKEGELVRWSPDGTRFVVQSESSLDIYSTEMSLLHTLSHSKRIQDVRFHRAKSGEEFLLVAAEDKKVTIYSTSSEDSTSLPVVAEAIGHENRVKAIDTLRVTISRSKSERVWTSIMSTVSSDGWIRIFNLGALDTLTSASTKEIKQLEAIASYDTKGSRLTCCVLADGEASVESVTGKRKYDVDEGNDTEIEDPGDTLGEVGEGANGG